MTTLHLGVVDVPYADAGGKTTGDVAEILEAKYHVMRIFFQLNDKKIVKYLEDGVRGHVENIIMGGPASGAPFAEGLGKIESRFRDFLSRKEMDSLGYPGVPTAAALRGVSHRFKKPGSRRAPRPSFVDTGLFQSSFRAWVD